MSKKIFISSDIEGTAGDCIWECGKKGTDEYQQQCVILKNELLAVVDEINLIEKDCEIVIKDAHSTGWNYDILDFPENCKIIRGWDDGLSCMMQGLDKSFDAVILVGYHSGAGMNGSPLAHTFNSRRYQRILVNGVLMTEFLINYWISCMYQVPVIMISGDKGICEEALKYNDIIRTAIVQEGIGGSVVSVSEKKAERILRECVRAALKNGKQKIEELPPYFSLDIEYFSHVDANRYSYYPGCTRVGAKTIHYETDDFCEVLRTLLFV